MFPFIGISTFLKAPLDKSRPLGFMGIPYDAVTTFRPGARMGPSAVREASKMLTDGQHPGYHVDPSLYLGDHGDIDIGNVDPVDVARNMINKLADLNPHMMFCGGDHSVTRGILNALKRKKFKDADIQLVIFDAHHDCWERHAEGGDRCGHGTWVRNVINDGAVKPADVYQIGVRSPSDYETSRWLSREGGSVWSGEDAMRYAIGGDFVRERMSLDPDKPTYISFDIDALDPAYAPGTGTPEVGGLSTMWAVQALRSILKSTTTVGMDVVEVSPSYDGPGQITALAAASLLYTYASYHAKSFAAAERAAKEEAEKAAGDQPQNAESAEASAS